MDDALHLVVAVVGIVLVGTFFRSIIRVALLNRRPDDVFLNLAGFVTALLFIRVPATHDDRTLLDRRGLWYWPVSQLILIAIWFITVVIGFACLYWAADSVSTVEAAFIASGSALSTLGFATPPDTTGQVLAVAQGMIGLGIVVFVFTFIPGYLATIQQREDQVAWVYARAGADPTGAALLEWLVADGQAGSLASQWETWEAWFRSMGENQALSPLLAFDRSVRRGESWVAASGAMLDASAFAASALVGGGSASAEVCVRTGVDALRLIDQSLTNAMRRMPASVPVPELSRAAFDALCERLAAAGVPLRADLDAAFGAFEERRARYAGLVSRLGLAVTPGHGLVGWSLRRPHDDSSAG